jgi:hypothetical protein
VERLYFAVGLEQLARDRFSVERETKLMSTQVQDFVAEHAALIGRVAIAWNDLNFILSYLFEQFTGMTKEKAAAIYFLPRSDSTQRQMLSAVAQIALRPYPDILSSFNECMKRINLLAGERNAAMHTSWAVAIPGGHFVPAPQLPIHGSLKPDFAAQFEALKDNLNNQFFALDKVRREFERLRLQA